MISFLCINLNDDIDKKIAEAIANRYNIQIENIKTKRKIDSKKKIATLESNEFAL